VAVTRAGKLIKASSKLEPVDIDRPAIESSEA